MIASFGDDATADFFHGEWTKAARKWQPVEKVAQRKLDMVNAAARLDDLKVPPGNRLEKLSGDLDGFHSIRINEKWRIVFEWKEGGAHQVKITDYHS